MKSEYYNLEIVYKGKIRQIPVTIDVRSVGNKISAVVDGVKSRSGRTINVTD
ncbi:hypothetical protein MKQ70_20125 [Chitinophaga sedimenti]|uniref:hypothetical protein n=1 Tax=Chitinophaga sedimenti TaxID=2033606 RepID=UPI002002C439|nr:hypothetical protein [Chitinophaga sedimenti]MCK7557185.1 hypothetical protein [Chitinophaga sedimenti]